MAVPNTDELYAFLTGLMDHKQDPHAIFEWSALNTSAFRYFKSKVAPINRVMKELVTDGRLTKVRVTNGGYVYLDRKEFETSLFSLYFQYSNMRYGSGDWGTVTTERSPDHENVWREGARYLYTTGDRYTAMVDDFLKAKAEHDEKARQEKSEDERQVQELLTAIAPDGAELLERVGNVIPGLERRLRSRSFADQENLYLSFDLRNAEQIGPFLDILRRGLPDVPRETSTD